MFRKCTEIEHCWKSMNGSGFFLLIRTFPFFYSLFLAEPKMTTIHETLRCVIIDFIRITSQLIRLMRKHFTQTSDHQVCSYKKKLSKKFSKKFDTVTIGNKSRQKNLNFALFLAKPLNFYLSHHIIKWNQVFKNNSKIDTFYSWHTYFLFT